MSLIVLGLSGALMHDPSAALYVDGKLVAAAEEERFIRDKHAKNQMPLHSARFCMEFAGIRPDEVDVVAFPFAKVSLLSPARWHFAKRYWRFLIKKMGDFFMLENRNSQQSCKVYLTKATSYFIRFMYVPVLGKTSSFLVFIFF